MSYSICVGSWCLESYSMCIPLHQYVILGEHGVLRCRFELCGRWSRAEILWIIHLSVRRNANRGTGRKFCTHTQNEHNCHFGRWTLPCPKPFCIISVSDPSIYFAICVCSTCSNCSQSWWQWEWSFLFWLIFKAFFERDSSANNTGRQARVSRYCSMLSNLLLQYLWYGSG